MINIRNFFFFNNSFFFFFFNSHLSIFYKFLFNDLKTLPLQIIYYKKKSYTYLN